MLLTRPLLPSLTKTPGGGIMLDRYDAADLLIYLENLERALGVGND